MSASESRTVVVAALLANLGIAISKFVAFFITGSSSMLAEAVHSVADTSNQGVLLLGGHRAGRAPSRTHQFGYARVRYFSAFLVALLLFTVGGLFALYEGVEKVLHPHEIDSPLVAIGVLLVAIVLEGLSFRTAMRETRKVKGKLSWVGFIRHSRNPELPVVLLEDSGALLGLTFALVGVLLAMGTGNGVWDGIGTLAIGLLLLAISAVLVVETRSLLLGEAASPEQESKIMAELQGTPGVTSVIHLRTQHLGPEDLLVAAKIELPVEMAMPQVAATINAAETRVRAVVPIARLMFLEPDLRGADGRAAGADGSAAGRRGDRPA